MSKTTAAGLLLLLPQKTTRTKKLFVNSKKTVELILVISVIKFDYTLSLSP